MREADTRWQSNVHALVLHPTQPRVLMQHGPEGWSLSPFVQFGLRVRFGDVALALQEIGHTLNTNVTAVRWTHIHSTQQGRESRVESILTLECTDPAWVPPPHLHWIDRPTVGRLALTLPHQREVIAACLREEETHTAPRLRLPWERRGWFRQAASWVQTRLEQAGRTATGPVEQIRIWGISCILRVPTTDGPLFQVRSGSSRRHP